MRSLRLAMAVQPSLFGTMAMEIGAAHSLKDLSFSIKTQTKSVLEILVLAIPTSLGGPRRQLTAITCGCLSGLGHAGSVGGRSPKLPSGRYPLVDLLDTLTSVIPWRQKNGPSVGWLRPS